ncbi:KfrA protein [Cupriavidus sp. GA3-3]|uniref:hypothetical protein n=1 Tax=Cupriavidus TaxID=106589 RepID=UPI00032EDEC2|nr:MULTISPECIES: hypothetical protein [Cupriavidus]EON18849.1 KfrA protein [Cupriavidus sp. GA3-3]
MHFVHAKCHRETAASRAEAALANWQAASAAAATDLAALRAEARHQAHAAETARDQAAAECEASQQAPSAVTRWKPSARSLPNSRNTVS